MRIENKSLFDSDKESEYDPNNYATMSAILSEPYDPHLDEWFHYRHQQGFVIPTEDSLQRMHKFVLNNENSNSNLEVMIVYFYKFHALGYNLLSHVVRWHTYYKVSPYTFKEFAELLDIYQKTNPFKQ